MATVVASSFFSLDFGDIGDVWVKQSEQPVHFIGFMW